MKVINFNIKRTIRTILFGLSVFSPFQSNALTVKEIMSPRQEYGNWITDTAAILSDKTKTKLARLISQLEQRNETEITIVTIPETALFNHWRIGNAEEDNRVLFLVSPGDRRVEIETGYGYNRGMLVGTQALVKTLQNKTDGTQQRAKTSLKKTNNTEMIQSDQSFGITQFFGLILIVLVILGLLFNDRKLRHYGTESKSSIRRVKHFEKRQWNSFVDNTLINLLSILNLLIIGLNILYLILFFLVMLLIMFLKFSSFSTTSNKFRRELDEFLNAAIPAIFSNWSSLDLTRRASYNLLRSVEKNELQEIFNFCSQNFGRLIYYQASKGCWKSGSIICLPYSISPTSLWEIVTNQPEHMHWKILVNYKTEVLFEKGRAEIETQLVKEYGRYYINSLNINTGSEWNQRSFRLGTQATLDASSNLSKPQMFFDF